MACLAFSDLQTHPCELAQNKSVNRLAVLHPKLALYQ
jgi:hypothetical protein